MTRKKGSRSANRNGSRPRPGGYRAPAPAPQPTRRGFLDSLFSPRSLSPMPRLRSSLGRSAALVLSTPWLLAGVPLAVLAEFLVLMAFGFEGPFRVLVAAFAPPGIGTYFDGSVSQLAFGSLGAGQASIFGIMFVRAALHALVGAIAVERLRTGSVSTWAFRRAVRILPVAFTANMMGLALLLVGNFIGVFVSGGLGLGLLVLVLAMGLAMNFGWVAPAIAADEDRRMGETMQRAFRVARLPGSSSLTLAVTYTILGFIAFSVYSAGGPIGANPPISEWLWVGGANLASVVVLVLGALRYLSVADQVPEGPAPRRARAPRGRR